MDLLRELLKLRDPGKSGGVVPMAEDKLTEEDEDSLGELIEKYCDQEKMHHFEGESGVKNLEKVVEAIGYEGHSFRYGEPIYAFLTDNPGAQTAILEWINDQDTDEWKEKVREHLHDEDEENVEEALLNERGNREDVGKEHFKKKIPTKVFASGTPAHVATWLKRTHPSLKSAVSALNNYINQHEDLSDERLEALGQAKIILQTSFEKKKEHKEKKKDSK